MALIYLAVKREITCLRQPLGTGRTYSLNPGSHVLERLSSRIVIDATSQGGLDQLDRRIGISYLDHQLVKSLVM